MSADGLSDHDRAEWEKACQLHHTGDCALLGHWRNIADLTSVIRHSLRESDHLRAVFQCLLLWDHDASIAKAVFEELVYTTSYVHGQIAVCRKAVRLIPLDWVRPRLIPVMLATIERDKKSPLWKTGWEDELWQRYAELLWEIDHDLLKEWSRLALRHENPLVREVGQDCSEWLAKRRDEHRSE